MLRLSQRLAVVLVGGALLSSPALAWSDPPKTEAEKPAQAQADEAQAEEAQPEKPEGEKPAAEAEKAKTPPFLRVRKDDDEQPLALETAVVSFITAGEKHRDVVVDLIGAVHVADGKYYEDLNKLFESYDVVLYELVAPEGTRVPKGGRREVGNPIASIQGGMKSLLDLEFQLEKVDYTKANFVHADMSPEEFAKSMKDRGESIFQMILKAMGQSMAMQASGKQQVSDVELMAALFAKDRPMRLKKIMARQMEDMDASIGAFQGDDGGSTIITERNKKCLEVLKKELAKDGRKRIGIFYGAGHLADMEERLIADFGLKRGEEKWFTAWDLTGGKLAEKKPEAKPVDERDPFDDSDQPKLKKAG